MVAGASLAELVAGGLNASACTLTALAVRSETMVRYNMPVPLSSPGVFAVAQRCAADAANASSRWRAPVPCVSVRVPVSVRACVRLWRVRVCACVCVCVCVWEIVALLFLFSRIVFPTLIRIYCPTRCLFAKLA